MLHVSFQSKKCVKHFIFHETCFLIYTPLPFIETILLLQGRKDQSLFQATKFYCRPSFSFWTAFYAWKWSRICFLQRLFFYLAAVRTTTLTKNVHNGKERKEKKTVVLQRLINWWRHTGYISVPQSIRIPTPLNVVWRMYTPSATMLHEV